MNFNRIILISLLFFHISIHLGFSQTSDEAIIVRYDTIYFAHDSDTIDQLNTKKLYAISNFFTNVQIQHIHIEGHANSLASNSYNDVLSLQRANAVKNALYQMKIDSTILKKIDLNHFGENKATGQLVNDRKVEIISLYTLPDPPSQIKQQPAFLSLCVEDAITKDKIPSTVFIHYETKTDTIYTEKSVCSDYIYKTGDKILKIEAYADCYFFAQIKPSQLIPIVETIQLQLEPLKENSTINIPNILFAGNRDILLVESMPTMHSLIIFMQKNTCFKIEIAGHINLPNRPPVTQESWHFILSEKRAKKVYQYLIENDINPKWISYKGYGNHQMLYPNAKEEKYQKLNRRVEIRVIE